MGYKYMKEEEFNRIKALLDAGVSRGQVVTVTKRSGALVEVDPEHIRRAGPAIKAITTGFAVGRNRILGLGEDNQVYSFENQE